MLKFLIGLAVCLSAISFGSVDAEAFTITSTDMFGNETVLIDVDEKDLEVDELVLMPLAMANPPEPNRVAAKVPSLQKIINDSQIPNSCSFLYIDYGPNWKEIMEEGTDYYLYGRYQYFFYGESKDGVVTNGWGSGTSAYTYNGTAGSDPANFTLEFAGPYALVSYNDETDSIYIIENTYDSGVGTAHIITFTGMTTYNDSYYMYYYPRLLTFGNDVLDEFPVFGLTMYLEYDEYVWNEDWNGNLSDEGNQEKGFWELITEGKFTSSDNPIIQLFATIISSIGDLIQFVQDIPDLVSGFLDFLPEEWKVFLMSGVSLIVFAIIFKIALMFIK